MKRRVRFLFVAGIIGLLSTAMFASAHASSFDNGQWTTVLSGPSIVVVGMPAQFVVTLTNDHPSAVGLNPPFTLAISGGVSGISVTSTGCAGSLSGTVGPATYTSCPTNPPYLLAGGGSVTYTVSFTPTVVGQISMTYTDIDGSTQISAMAVIAQNAAASSGSGSSSYQPKPNYSGSAFDIRCMNGCPPGGLP